MEPNIDRFNNEIKEKQRLKNVEEYKRKFFKNLKKHKSRKR